MGLPAHALGSASWLSLSSCSMERAASLGRTAKPTCLFPQGRSSPSTSSFMGQNHVGWVVGAGGEWRLFGSNWLLRVEYLHYDFKDTTLTVTGRNTTSSPPSFTSVFQDSVDFRNRMTTDVVRGGVSYKC